MKNINKVQVKSLKVYPRMSDDSNCFDCKIYINGKAAIYSKDGGYGGDIEHNKTKEGSSYNWEDINQWVYDHNKEVKETVDKYSFYKSQYNSLDVLCDIGIHEWFRKQDINRFKRKLKTNVIVSDDKCKDDEYYFWKLKRHTQEQVINHIKKLDKYINPVILNELPIEKAIEKWGI